MNLIKLREIQNNHGLQILFKIYDFNNYEQRRIYREIFDMAKVDVYVFVNSNNLLH